MTNLDWHIRFDIAKSALFGDVSDIFESCYKFVVATVTAIDKVESKKKARKTRSDKGVKRVQRKGTVKPVRAKRNK